ncbi:MAG: homogentisate 1,2-dioxygenase [Gammaproteobacteria bacterium RIFCSPHIGHO2_12_FULL_45_9]|nr:MAG: homogentisate 1,2-dioxygenase [Gammaproteobacteria bacterium RIFCSPHIGHO2_12_FULL_45_9]
MNTPLQYLSGFGNQFESEAHPDTLIKGRNSPQKSPHGLYTEQLNGSAFTMPRAHNLRSWFYRIRPSVLQGEFFPYPNAHLLCQPTDQTITPPTPMRWNPMPYPNNECHFIEGLMTFASNGSVEMHTGAAIHLYAINNSMTDEFFYNADGEMLIVLQEGDLCFHTEFGIIDASPGEIVVIPRGVKFQVVLLQEKARGYLCENYGAPFRLPELGVIGANGLANPRDFLTPVAAYDEREGNFKLLAKFQGRLWEAKLQHSPLDVVAWHGNYVPYKYDLSLFNAMNSVSYDHADPSIFSVLTSPSATHGLANVDFVIFPPRWVVSENTFRPPYFHRNLMSEYMGLIKGTYDAKEGGFVPGGGSLHNGMTAHGPDASTYQQAIESALKPEYYGDTLAFMFESQFVWRLTPLAFHADFRQANYQDCWIALTAQFNSDKHKIDV